MKSKGEGGLWPQVRNVLMRPERWGYVRRKAPDTEACVFCQAAGQKPSSISLCLKRTDKVMVMLNKFPYNTGHLMVLPTRHCGDIQELEEAEYLEAMIVLRQVMQILTKEYQCPGLNVGLNHGAAAGAGIPGHLHWHVVPRWVGDTNFFPLIAETKVIPEALERTYERLQPYFNGG